MLTPGGCLSIEDIYISSGDHGGEVIYPVKYYALSLSGRPLCIQTAEGKWGYFLTDKTWVIEPQYDGALPFSEDLAAVKVGPYWQYINEQNETVISGNYTEVTSFSDGLAHVYLEDFGWQIIDNTGAVIYFPN